MVQFVYPQDGHPTATRQLPVPAMNDSAPETTGNEGALPSASRVDRADCVVKAFAEPGQSY